jgi:hypothetical protein
MMNRILATALLGLSFSFALSAPVQASDDDAKCGLYARIGGTMSDFMMPLTVKDFVDIMAGKNDALMGELTASLLTGLGSDHLATMISLQGDESAVLGEAAGTVMMELLMTGQATSSEEVEQLMNKTCNAIGVETLMQNQRKAAAANSQNASGK